MCARSALINLIKAEVCETFTPNEGTKRSTQLISSRFDQMIKFSHHLSEQNGKYLMDSAQRRLIESAARTVVSHVVSTWHLHVIQFPHSPKNMHKGQLQTLNYPLVYQLSDVLCTLCGLSQGSAGAHIPRESLESPVGLNTLTVEESWRKSSIQTGRT